MPCARTALQLVSHFLLSHHVFFLPLQCYLGIDEPGFNCSLDTLIRAEAFLSHLVLVVCFTEFGMHVTNLKLNARHLETRTSKLTYSFRDTSTMRTGSRNSKRHYRVRARRRLSICDFPSLQALFCYPIAALSKIYLLQGARHTHTIRYEIRLDYVIEDPARSSICFTKSS